MEKGDSNSTTTSATRHLRFHLRGFMCVIAVVCASVAAFAHVGSLGGALASLLLAAACIYVGLRKSVLLIFAGGALLVLAAYHCIQFLLSGRG